ncbi:MAG: ABC-F family ATP-binding cassette domain-containing protein [Magnetococcales bacterium]|nr:ABC-F family ATP-binding cassette domain-containing protein [Magnetococcales bacterium]
MLRLEKISKRFGARLLLESADLAIHGGEKVGLIGPNGAGKTTLFRILLHQEECDAGRVEVLPHTRMGILRQELVASACSILNETLQGDRELIGLEQEREHCQQLLQQARTPVEQEQTSQRLGEIHHRLETIDAYSAHARAGAILMGLGFSRADLDQPLAAFSGGWRMRVALAQLLFSRPDLMLLDEPTNHLDLESVSWLESYLQRLSGTLIVISHDRAFLNRVTTVTVEIDNATLTRYQGNFDASLEQKAARLHLIEKETEKRAQKAAELERFINRFRAKATKARQVQSRVKALERLGPIAQQSREKARAPHIRLPEPASCAREVLTIRGLSKGFADKRVLAGVGLSVWRGEKIGLLGANGYGKSTLLKLIAGQLLPDSGTLQLGDRVRPAYYAQHAADALDAGQTIFESARTIADRGIIDQEIRALLGGFLFSGDIVFNRVSVLSGGERARLALARLFLTGSNFLLLDEPTNHLDMHARANLEEALESYTGTLILVSHDRDLLEGVCDRYLVVGEGVVRPLEGGVEAYLAQVTATRSTAPGEASPGAGGDDGREAPAARSEREQRRHAADIRNRLHRETRDLRTRSQTLEQKISALEGERALLQGQLADATLYDVARKDALKLALAREGEINRTLDLLMAEWEEVSLAIEERETLARKEHADGHRC